MAAFLGISVWITLATVVPGLVTIAAVYGALATSAPESLAPFLTDLQKLNDWVYAGFAVTVMVLTQLVGILLEGAFIRLGSLGPKELQLSIPEGIDPLGLTHFKLEPYSEYAGLYLLLAELREHEDSQGHLQRALAQFFLTNNILVSFTVGIVVSVAALAISAQPARPVALVYVAALLACLVVSYRVARIRFEVMAKALWAARRRRLEKIPSPLLDGD
jgi:hypothetical protein